MELGYAIGYGNCRANALAIARHFSLGPFLHLGRALPMMGRIKLFGEKPFDFY